MVQGWLLNRLRVALEPLAYRLKLINIIPLEWHDGVFVTVGFVIIAVAVIHWIAVAMIFGMYSPNRGHPLTKECAYFNLWHYSCMRIVAVHNA